MPISNMNDTADAIREFAVWKKGQQIVADGNNQMIDITAPKYEVEIAISKDYDGNVIWVNVDGICRLRICRVSSEIIKIDDRRVP